MMQPYQMRLPDAVRAAVERVAHDEDRSVSSMIRALIKEGLRNRGEWPIASANSQGRGQGKPAGQESP
jgi:hypothetical protein